MKYQGIAKVQHYVPQFLLKSFGVGKKQHLHVYDKKTGRTFQTNSKNVAGESRFYDFEFEGHMLTIEPSLSQIEAKAKTQFRRLLESDSLKVLSEEDRAILAVFFAIQFTRTRCYREQWRALPELLGDKLRRSALNCKEQTIIEEYIQPLDENQNKIEAVRSIINAPKDFAIHFANKIWILLKAERRTPFLIGDNPLALQNSMNMEPYGNIGLAAQGIEIYFPLSPVRALALWCPSHEEMFQRAIIANSRDPLAIRQTVDAIETGCPLQFQPMNVINFNSLQIRFSERYIFSNIDDFSLAQEMVTSYPNLRFGPRVQIS